MYKSEFISPEGCGLLLKPGHDLVNLIVGVTTGSISIYFFSAIPTGATVLIQVGILGGTGALKLPIFKEDDPYGHQNEKDSQES